MPGPKLRPVKSESLKVGASHLFFFKAPQATLMHQPSVRTSVLEQCFSHFDGHVNHLRTLLNSKFWFSRSGVGLRFFTPLPDEAWAVGRGLLSQALEATDGAHTSQKGYSLQLATTVTSVVDFYLWTHFTHREKNSFRSCFPYSFSLLNPFQKWKRNPRLQTISNIQQFGLQVFDFMMVQK